MKIAVSLSGQPYSTPECLSTFINNVLQLTSCDVFSHFWFDSSYIDKCYKMHYNMKLQQTELIDKFNSKYIQQDPNHRYDLSFFQKFNNTWENMSLNYYKMMTPIFLYGYLCQTESICKSYYHIDDSYDIIIKTRPDILYTQNLIDIISQINFDNNTIYFQDSMTGGHLYAGEFSHNICDWFYIGNTSTMKKFNQSLYEQIPYEFSNGVLHMRDYNRKICENNGINVKLVDFGALIFKQTRLFDQKYKNNIQVYLSDFDFVNYKPKNPELWPYWIEFVDFGHFKNIE